MTPMAFSHSVVLMAAISGLLWSEYLRGPNPAERVAHPIQAADFIALSGLAYASGYV
jgi:hypothetical protein